MTHRFLNTPPTIHYGFTLIEVLVALVVLSIGVLGIASLQVATLASTHDAYLQSVSAIQATDLEERIRANRGASDEYLDLAGDGDLVGISELVPKTLPTSCQAPSAGCDKKSLAAYDTGRWAWMTAALFPPTLKVRLQKLNGTSYRLTMSWSTPKKEKGSNNHEVNFLFQVRGS